MLSSIFTLALLSTSVFAVEEKRQATNAEQFTSAADQLISAYIPSSALPIWEAAVSAGASVASVTGDAKSLLHSALFATSLPDWLVSAVPTQYSTQLQALESNINQLRGTVGAPAATQTNVPAQLTTQVVNGVTTVFPVAGAGAAISSAYTTVVDGVTSVYTSAVNEASPVNSVVTTVVDGVTSVYTSAVSGASSVVNVVTTEVVNGVTSVFTTAVSGAASVGSDAASVGSSLTTQVVNGVTSVFSTAVNGASSVASDASSGISSIASDATQGISSILNAASSAVNPNPTTTTATGGAPTGVIGGAAGLVGLIGVMIAL